MIGEEKKENKDLIEKSINYLENNGFTDIKADLPGFTPPKSFIKKKDGLNIAADITARKNGRNFFFDIGLKSEKSGLLKSKWLLLDTVAQLKSNSFKVITTRGHIKFTERLLQEANLAHKSPIRI